MGEVKHTPGPWHVSNGNLIRVTTKNFEGQCICGVHRIGKFSGNAYGDPLANARLIAAAPDLLVALSGLLERYVGLVESGDAGFWDAEKEDCVIKARAALSKATPSLHEGERDDG